MGVPHDRDSLHIEVDERYHARHPDAPYTLDPDDASHAAWIDVWIGIRDEVLNDATNWHFFEQYPDAPPHLDPNDASQRHYVDEWIRIRDEILGDGVAPPSAPTSPAPDPDPVDVALRASWESFEEAASALEARIQLLLQITGLGDDSAFAQHMRINAQTARTMFASGYFATHDEWTSEKRDFDEPTGYEFMDVGVQVRIVGTTGIVRMGITGSGPSDVGGWENYGGAPTQ